MNNLKKYLRIKLAETAGKNTARLVNDKINTGIKNSINSKKNK